MKVLVEPHNLSGLTNISSIGIGGTRSITNSYATFLVLVIIFRFYMFFKIQVRLNIHIIERNRKKTTFCDILGKMGSLNMSVVFQVM